MADKHTTAQADYGTYAPYVMRNLTLAGFAVLGLSLASFLAWPGRAGRIAGSLLLAAFLIGVAESLYMIWTMRVGRFRARERLLDLAGLHGGDRVLDVGCGRGLILTAAARRLTTGTAVGVDIWNSRDQSGNHPDATRRNAALEGVADRVEVMDGDARSLPFADQSFDVVLSSLVLHNLSDRRDREQALGEMLRVLKPGGRIAVLDFRHAQEYADALARMGAAEVRVTGPHYLIFPPVRIVTARRG